ncbi:hypothetical protein [Kiloniella sp.]|uniref:hypothetical protein n=1 Tax=Kiloniella sp. TaxID=1938587 RepID=UPI003B02A23B
MGSFTRRVWSTLATSFFIITLSSCNTVVFEYAEPIINDNTKLSVQNSTDGKTAFLQNANDGEGYYSLKMRFLPVNHPELPTYINSLATNPISPSKSCKRKVKDLEQKKISGFAGIYVGDPISKEDLINNANIRSRVKLGHYFVMIDPEKGSGIHCYVDEQNYQLTRHQPWDLDAIPVNVIWFNGKKIESGIDDISDNLGDLFKHAPLDHVFDLAELTAVDGSLKRIGELVDNYLSDAEISIKPQSFQINTKNKNWDQKTRRYFELNYLIRNTDNKIVGTKRTVGFVELQFEVTPSVFGKPKKPKGYPNFSTLKLDDLPKTEVKIDNASVSLEELVLKHKNGLAHYKTKGASNTFHTKCSVVESRLKHKFKLAKIDRATVLSVFAEQSYPAVFRKSINFPSLLGLPKPLELTNDEPREEQLDEQARRKEIVAKRLAEINILHAYYAQTCLTDYLSLMKELYLATGVNYSTLSQRKDTIEKKLKEFKFDFPPLTDSQKITQIGNRFTRTFQISPSDRAIKDFNWISDSIEFRVLSKRPKSMNDLGSGKTLSREKFVDSASSLVGQFGCFLNVKIKDQDSDGFSRSDKYFGWSNFNMVGIYDDLISTEPGTEIGLTGFAMVLLRFENSFGNDLPKVTGVYFLDPLEKHVQLIKKEVKSRPCRRQPSTTAAEHDSGGILARLGGLMKIDTTLASN